MWQPTVLIFSPQLWLEAFDRWCRMRDALLLSLFLIFSSLSLSLSLLSHYIYLTAGLSAGFCCNPCLIQSTKRMSALFLLSLPVCLVPPCLWWHLWIITQLPSLFGIITCWHDSEGDCQIGVHLNLDHLCYVLDHHEHYDSELIRGCVEDKQCKRIHMKSNYRNPNWI